MPWSATPHDVLYYLVVVVLSVLWCVVQAKSRSDATSALILERLDEVLARLNRPLAARRSQE